MDCRKSTRTKFLSDPLLTWLALRCINWRKTLWWWCMSKKQISRPVENDIFYRGNNFAVVYLVIRLYICKSIIYLLVFLWTDRKSLDKSKLLFSSFKINDSSWKSNVSFSHARKMVSILPTISVTLGRVVKLMHDFHGWFYHWRETQTIFVMLHTRPQLYPD